MNALDLAEARASDDPVKRDLELTCVACGEVLCDIEHGDTLEVLVAVTKGHECGLTRQHPLTANLD